MCPGQNLKHLGIIAVLNFQVISMVQERQSASIKDAKSNFTLQPVHHKMNARFRFVFSFDKLLA